MNNLISIIVPAYRAEKFIDRCVESLVAQTHSNIEIILVNDGSPDNSGIICDKWAEKDNRIVVIHKKNQGVAAARQSGIEKSTGEYIMFVDSDDWIRADTCEYLLRLINKGEYQAACCGYSLTESNDEPPESDDELITVLDNEGTIKGLYDYSLWSIWAKLFKRELFDKAEIPEIKLTVSEDLLTNFYLFSCCDNIIVSSKEKYLYFRHPDSVMTRLSLRRVEDQLSAYRTICNELQPDTMSYIYSMANRLLNDFQLVNSAIYGRHGKEMLKPVIDDIRQCKKYVFSSETDYCLGTKYKLATVMLMLSPSLYAFIIRLSGKQY